MADNRQYPKFQIEWLWAFFPAFLGLGIVMLLGEFDIIELNFSIHDLDTFIILSGLILTISIASVIISREGLRQMRNLTEVQLQRQYADEHARFLRRLDHEIKNPLMGIETALENLAETTAPQERKQIRSAISAQIERLSHLITDLRKIAEMDRHALENYPIDLCTLIDDVYSFASEYEEAKNRQMSLNLPTELPRIFGDYDLLLLAIYNVLTNAIKYSRTGDRVALSVTRQEQQLTISVHDSGAGILPEDLPYVWDELYRSQSAKSIQGSGIGLALVRRIIERHGGSVSIMSDVSEGTTVNLMLPIRVEK